MEFSKTFEKVAKTVSQENAKVLPDVFVTEGKPEATDIALSELGEKDEFGRFTIAKKDTAVKAKFARGVAENLDSYNLVVQVSNRDIKIPGADPIKAPYRVWRLVAA